MWSIVLEYLWQTIYLTGTSFWVQAPVYVGATLAILKLVDSIVYSSSIINENKLTLDEAQRLMQMVEYATSCYKSDFSVANSIFCQSQVTDSEAYIWSTESELYIAFRGTEDPRDVLYDLDVRTVDIDPGVYVHRGFHSHFFSIEPLLTEHLEKYVQRGGTRVILIGHSLGGALASISAYHYNSIYHNLDIWTYTIGSPRVGNVTFAENECHKKGCRIYNYQDPVPMMPISYRFEHTITPALCLTTDIPKYTESDLPWYYRPLSLLRLDLQHPVEAHYSATYSSILHKLAGH